MIDPTGRHEVKAPNGLLKESLSYLVEKDVHFGFTPPLPLSEFVPFWLTPSPLTSDVLSGSPKGDVKLNFEIGGWKDFTQQVFAIKGNI